MVVNWLRQKTSAAILFVVIRLYLGWTWTVAGWGKITSDKSFNATGFLQGAVKKAAGENPAVQWWWRDFLEGFAIPNVKLFNFLVPWGEFLVGIALLTGIFTTFAALMGAVMNFSYMFSGAVSTNPQLVILTIILLIAGSNAGKVGLDYYVLPYMRKWMGQLFEAISNMKNQTV